MVKMKKEKIAAAVQPEKKKAEPAEMISEPAFVDTFHLLCKGGRPPAFKSAEEMAEKATAYFLEKENAIIFYTKDGKPINGQGSISVQGVCDYMGITNQTLNEYGKKKEFEYTVTRIKKICEVYLIDRCNLSKDHKADWILQNCFDGWKTESTTKLISEEPAAERLKKFLTKKKKGSKTAKK